jgi:hypothetical protein
MPNMPRTSRHEIDLDDLAWGMGLDRASQRMQRLIENLDRMMDARVVWNLLDEHGDLEEWESATLLPYVKVKAKERRVTYEFTQAFQERVYNPSEFAEIALRMQRVFRSEHALALYENTRRFLLDGETPWIPIDVFKKLMGVDAKPYYDEYKYLSARLIKPSMQQVADCSDIVLRLKTRRRNRRVAEIKFLVEDNPQMALFTESLRQDLSRARGTGDRRTLIRLASFQIGGKRAEQLLEQFELDNIHAGLDAAEAWMLNKEKAREPIHNPAGVAYKAITEGWRLPQLVTAEESPTKSPALNDAAATTTLKDRTEELRKDFRRQWYTAYFDTLDEQERRRLLAGFEAELERQSNQEMVLKRLRSSGITGMVFPFLQLYLSTQGIEPADDEFHKFVQEHRRSRTRSAD